MAQSQVPVTVLTGYLGAGKTTLLNRILSEQHGKKYAVIVNEFGELGVDNDLVVNADEEVFEMNNGCICCTVRGDLIRIIEGLMKRKDKFDGILVETTGLADPGPVAQTFFTDEDVKARTRLDAIVTVIDAKHFFGQLEQGSEAEQQVAFADVILLNKTDLVSPDELAKVEDRIRGINRYARIFHTQNSQIALDAILDKGAFDLGRILEFEPDFLHSGHDHHHEDEVRSLSITADRPVDPDRFQKWMGALLQIKGGDIFRSKGILAIDGAPRRYVYQGVHMMMDSDWGTPWKDGDKRSSKLVFIGRNLDGDNLQRGFDDCLK
ncbi:GTP-binding protein [Reyranella sp.]|uniref:CobW family GTP-binding protein n=1 Tax=Reyranella sp. TaxID=1929291 RepID=UPI002722B04A|nr:GTP-binding protein [Reyranella sp.]MDO8975805.1 GTP-binding protein [Reyranella sp.]